MRQRLNMTCRRCSKEITVATSTRVSGLIVYLCKSCYSDWQRGHDATDQDAVLINCIEALISQLLETSEKKDHEK